MAHGHFGGNDELTEEFRLKKVLKEVIGKNASINLCPQSGHEPSCTCSKTAGAGHCLVLDPFAGSGTVLAVAKQFGRDYLRIELNPEYISLAHDRLDSVQPSLWQSGG